jgi:hypothetical protein
MINIRLSILGIIAFILLGTIDIKAQTNGFFDDFEDGILSCKYKDDPTHTGTYSFSEHDGVLEVNVNQTTTEPTFFWVDFGRTINVWQDGGNPLSFIVQSDSSFSISGGLGNNNGFSDPLEAQKIFQYSSASSASYTYSNYVSFHIAPDYEHGIDATQVTKFLISINPNGIKPFKGKIYLRQVSLGKIGNTSMLNGGIEECTITNIDILEPVMKSKPVAIYNLFGQEVLDSEANNGVFIYHFADGSKTKIVK